MHSNTETTMMNSDSVGADALRDLLDIEILLVGGGDVIQFGG